MPDDRFTIFPTGDPAPPEYFTGKVWIRPLVSDDRMFNCVISNVTFEPGARNHWHTHPGGQILIITEGPGYYQERGKRIQLINKGDVIRIPPEVEHWHGAAVDSQMTHIAISTNTQNGVVNWLNKVTDEEYRSFR